MRRAATLSLAALCSCGIDARSVEVSPACVGAPSDGLVSDFSTARLGRCAAPTCPEALAGQTTASLGTTGVSGIVFPYERPDSVVLALSLTGDLHSIRDETSALRIVMSYDSLAREVPRARRLRARARAVPRRVRLCGASAFASTGASGLSPAPRQLLARPQRRDAGRDLPLDRCRRALGSTSAWAARPCRCPTRSARGRPLELAGMQCQFALPADGSRTCAADFTIDDLRLVAQAAPSPETHQRPAISSRRCSRRRPAAPRSGWRPPAAPRTVLCDKRTKR